MKTKAFNFKYILKVLLLTLLALITMLNTVSSITVFADDNVKNLDATDPLTDLKQDENFDLTKYSFNINEKFKLYSLVEYGYSFYPEQNGNFRLYLYVYNPQAIKFVNTSLNRIQMAVGYDLNGRPNDYKKYELKLVSSSAEPGYEGLFYKFKVIDDGTIYDRLSSTGRRYDVSGLELVSEGQVNATESNVSRTFIYSGFASGYGPKDVTESSLKCEYQNLETIELKVNSTYWRSKTSNRGVGYQNQLDSVYFSVPNRFFREYGNLQRIKAEWYEYQTKDIIVTSDETTYNAVKPYIGRSDLSGLNYGFAENLEELWTSDKQKYPLYSSSWCFNSGITASGISNSVKPLYYLFPTYNWCDIKEYDPKGDVSSTGGVTSNELYNYMLNYPIGANSTTIKGGKINADLFESDIEDYRKIDNEFGKIQYGYSFYDFDADVDILDWQTWNPEDHKFKENEKIYGWWKALWGKYDKVDTGNDAKDVAPILTLKDENFRGDQASISNSLYVNYNDVNLIHSAHNNAKKNDETLVLFRFALSDYYSNEITITNAKSDGYYIGQTNNKAYRAKESVFLDFDIIQLTFSDNGYLTVIPAVSDPIDIVDDITSPTIISNGTSFWKKLLAWVITIVACIIGLVLAIGIYKALLKIYTGDSHWIVKLLFTLPIVAVLVLTLIYALPWVLTTVKNLGGLK